MCILRTHRAQTRAVRIHSKFDCYRRCQEQLWGHEQFCELPVSAGRNGRPGRREMVEKGAWPAQGGNAGGQWVRERASPSLTNHRLPLILRLKEHLHLSAAGAMY